MKKYSDYQKGGDDLTNEELKSLPWTKFKIVVPTQEDKEELMEAFEKFHDEGFNSDDIVMNQLAHLYHDEAGDVIKVDKKMYNKLNSPK